MKLKKLTLALAFASTFVAGIAAATCLVRGLATQADRDRLRQDLGRLADTSEAFVKVARLAMPSVVHIMVSRTVVLRDPFDDFFNDPFFRRFWMPRRRFQQQGMGSGFLVDETGYILTNTHVVRDSDEILVRLSDKREFRARLVGADPVTDVAVLRIQAPDLLPVAIGDSDRLAVGQWVIAIGNPFGLEQTLTVGVVSAKGRANLGILDQEDFIQTDAAINPGNSGGPLLNVLGEVVGITNAIYSRTGGYQGIGFAIPIKAARTIMDEILRHGRVRRGDIGVHAVDLDEDAAAQLGLGKDRGAVIVRIARGSAAHQAELHPYDIVLKVGDAEVKDAAHFRTLISQAKIGSRVVLRILRRGREHEVPVKIGEQE